MSLPTGFIPDFGSAGGAPIQPPIDNFTADGAVTLVAGGIAILDKAGVGAYTLAAPAGNGAVLILVAGTANAHVVTIPTANAGGGAGQDVLTFGGAINDSIILVGYESKWYIAGAPRNVTAA